MERRGRGPAVAATGRMVIGPAGCLLLVALLRRRIGWRRPALQTYIAAAFGMWASMLCVYWGAQHIPSGLVSVIFGSPRCSLAGWQRSGCMERVFTPFRVLRMLLGIGGLAVIFGRAPVLGPMALPGVAAWWSRWRCMPSALSGEAWNARLHPLETTTGALIINVVPLHLLTWWLGGGVWPIHVPTRALGAIVYLGLFGSVAGFVLYYLRAAPQPGQPRRPDHPGHAGSGVVDRTCIECRAGRVAGRDRRRNDPGGSGQLPMGRCVARPAPGCAYLPGASDWPARPLPIPVAARR